MSKFLNETGLFHFWEKIKQHLTGNYLSLNGGTLNDDAEIVSHNTEKEVSATLSPKGVLVAKDNDSQAAYAYDSIVMQNQEGNTMLVNATGFSLFRGEDADDTSKYIASIQSSGVKANAFTKIGGKDVEVLMADGSTKVIGENSGIASLDENGKIPLSQLGNIDTTLFSIVTELPTKDIVKNRIYLVKADKTGEKNIYTEFIYTGDVEATYDATKWEKLGEYSSDVDLSSYSEKTETINKIDIIPNNTSVQVTCHKVEGPITDNAIPAATSTKAGVMTASDKKVLDTLAARYPLSISGFNVTPSLVQVGKATDATFSWSFNNSDFHPIESQKITVDGGEEQTVSVGTTSYKQTSLAGLTTAGTKSATIKINGTLTKSVSITYHYPSYIGVVAASATINEDNVKSLPSSIEWGKGKTATLVQNNQIIVYAYPASYGDLTSIKDANGFQGFAGYTKQTLSIEGQTYNVYVQKLPATSSSTYTFA